MSTKKFDLAKFNEFILRERPAAVVINDADMPAFAQAVRNAGGSLMAPVEDYTGPVVWAGRELSPTVENAALTGVYSFCDSSGLPRGGTRILSSTDFDRAQLRATVERLINDAAAKHPGVPLKLRATRDSGLKSLMTKPSSCLRTSTGNEAKIEWVHVLEAVPEHAVASPDDLPRAWDELAPPPAEKSPYRDGDQQGPRMVIIDNNRATVADREIAAVLNRHCAERKLADSDISKERLVELLRQAQAERDELAAKNLSLDTEVTKLVLERDGLKERLDHQERLRDSDHYRVLAGDIIDTCVRRGDMLDPHHDLTVNACLRVAAALDGK